jgi:hypothetical protein
MRSIAMARGQSGRIVLEIDVSLKNDLYTRLAKDGITLKDWFVEKAHRYLEVSEGPQQLTFDGIMERQKRL